LNVIESKRGEITSICGFSCPRCGGKYNLWYSGEKTEKGYYVGNAGNQCVECKWWLEGKIQRFAPFTQYGEVIQEWL
jgi:hypothetical protein